MSGRARCAGGLARRSQLVRARTRAKNEIHAVLDPPAEGPPAGQRPVRRKGRAWLAELELPVDERETVSACLRQVDFLDGEIAAVDRAIATPGAAAARRRCG